MKDYNSVNRPSTGDARLRLSTPVLCCWALAYIAGGCGGSTGPSGPTGLSGPSESLVRVNTTAEFNSTVLGSKQPVMTLFYKEGCPACVKQEEVLGHLAAEYHGRAVFAEYPLANPLGIVKNPELGDKYDLFIWPTTILFFDGKERKRWLTNDFPVDDYRKSLNEVTTIRRD
jgi:thiol-disulfide isomerase/thioredoxin